jgi:hypothetical protein
MDRINALEKDTREVASCSMKAQQDNGIAR